MKSACTRNMVCVLQQLLLLLLFLCGARAQREGCSAQFKRWYVDLSCSLTDESGSIDLFGDGCEWYQSRNGRMSRRLTVTSTRDEVRDEGSGSPVTLQCSARADLPLYAGTYVYHMVYSDQFSVEAQNLGKKTIKPPPPPTVTCDPDGQVEANTNVRCTCSSSSLGQPAGRLVWLILNNNSDDDDNPPVLRVGAYGQSSLTLRRNARRGERWRCDVQWAKNRTGPLSTFSVISLTLALNGEEGETTIKERDTLRVKCAVTGSDGVYDFTITDPSGDQTRHDRARTFNSYRPNMPCQLTGLITCSATNGVGPALTSSARVHVLCTPRSSFSRVPTMILSGKRGSVTFDVTANPAPDNVSITGPAADLSDVTLRGRCRQGDRDYLHTCTVTLEVRGDHCVEGEYTVAVHNEEGRARYPMSVRHGDVQERTTAIIELEQGETTSPSLPPPPSRLALGMGVAMALMIVIVVVVVATVVYLRRRRSNEEGAGQEREAKTGHGTAKPQSTFRQMDSSDYLNPGSSCYQDIGLSDYQDISSSHYYDRASSHYQDMGLSHYQEPDSLPLHKPTLATFREGPDPAVAATVNGAYVEAASKEGGANVHCEDNSSGQYESLRMCEVGQRSEYMAMKY